MTLEKKLLALLLGSAPFFAKELDKRLELFNMLLDRLLKALKKGLSPAEQKIYGDFLDNPGGGPLFNLATENTPVEGFVEIARQHGVDVSLKRDQTSGNYYLCLHGQQNEIINAAEQYIKQQRERQRPRSLTSELEREKLVANTRTATQPKEQERGPIEIDAR